mmetsp:Transcript_34580/g.79952  ORF Transcript_34580/g.79952 Transcript_34580/m.79952 type:complete len:145 (-) Transcript_34580:1161-1595(-)
MKKIERAEEKQTRIEPKKQIFHSCIVNIVIGTLYCEKGNYEFGISRIMKSMEPFEKKLGVDTWFHTKRALLALIENMTKQMLTLKDSTIDSVLTFLDDVDKYGKHIFHDLSHTPDPLHNQETSSTNSVAFEARQIKFLLLQIID